MRGKCQGFVLYRQTWQCNENITDCGGKRAVVLPTGCPRSAGLLAGICRTKVKVPAIPQGWGAVVTNDYIVHSGSITSVGEERANLSAVVYL